MRKRGAIQKTTAFTVPIASRGASQILALGAILLLLPWLAGCYSRVSEDFSTVVSPSRFKTVVLISGDDAGVKQAPLIRQKLAASGLTALRRSGEWETEELALVAVCDPGIDGVLFLWYNQLILTDCESHKHIYSIKAGYQGVDFMLKRFVHFLEARPS